MDCLFYKTFNAYDFYILLLDSVYDGGRLKEFFGCCFCCSFVWFGDWFSNCWFFLDKSCFKFSISSCRCLICLFDPSSWVWFVDELDHDSGFPLLFLIFNAFSSFIVVLCRVVVDIFILLHLYFIASEYKVFPVFWCGTSSPWTLFWLVLLGLYFYFKLLQYSLYNSNNRGNKKMIQIIESSNYGKLI